MYILRRIDSSFDSATQTVTVLSQLRQFWVHCVRKGACMFELKTGQPDQVPNSKSMQVQNLCCPGESLCPVEQHSFQRAMKFATHPNRLSTQYCNEHSVMKIYCNGILL